MFLIVFNVLIFNIWYNEISVFKILIMIKIVVYCVIIGVVNKNGIFVGKICFNFCIRMILIIIVMIDKNNVCMIKLFVKYEFFVLIVFNIFNCCVFCSVII